MKLTNKTKLPDILHKVAIQMERKVKGIDERVFSVTEILNGARLAKLVRLHEVEQDIQDTHWKFLGSAVHALVERELRKGDNSNYLVEETRRTIYKPKKGKPMVLVGTPDIYDKETKTIIDWKTSSAWGELDKNKHIAEGKEDRKTKQYRRQLTLYAYLLRKNGYEVENIQLVKFLKDFKKDKADSLHYPSTPIVCDKLPLCTKDSDIEAMLDEFIADWDADLADNKCSDDQRLAQELKYAIYEKTKSGSRKDRASKLFDDKDEALEWASKNNGTHIGTRNHKYVKCMSYCEYNKVCEQYKQDPGGSGEDIEAIKGVKQ